MLRDLVLPIVLSLYLQLNIEVLLCLISDSYNFRQHKPFFFILLAGLPINIIVFQPVLLVFKVVICVEITHDFVSICFDDLDSVFIVALGEL